MTVFYIKAATVVRKIGDFQNIAAVRKLPIIKNNPTFSIITEEEFKAMYAEELKAMPKAKGVAPRKSYGKESPETILRRKELRHILRIIESLKPLRDKLATIEASAKHQMLSDKTGGCSKQETDHWVSISMARDNIITALKRAHKRKGELIRLYATKAV